MQNIVLVCWLIFLAFWAVTAFSAKPKEEMVSTDSVGGARGILIGIIIFLILLKRFFDVYLGFLFQNIITLPIIIQDVGIAILVIGLAAALSARYSLGKNWSGRVSFQKGHKLVTTGPYAYIRHPIYLGMLLMGAGTLAVTDSTLVAIGAVLVIISFIQRIKKEEALMAKHFPKEYGKYQKRTKKLIPFVW